MKVCTMCGRTYATFVDFCFADGEVLATQDAALDVVEPEGFDAPPPPRMLQGSQQSSGYTRSATPVPRARRPGRGVLTNRPDGAGVYTPPAATPPPPPSAANPEDVPIASFPSDDDEVLEAPPGVDDVIAGEPYPPEAPPEPRPEPIIQRQPTPVPRPPTPAPAAASDEADFFANEIEEEDDSEGGAINMLVMAIGVILMLGVAIAIVVFIATGLLATGGDDTALAVKPDPIERLPDPVPQPDPAPVVDPQPVEPLQVGVQPSQPDPVVEPEPVTPDPEPVVTPTPTPTPDPIPTPVGDGRVAFNSVPTRATIVLDGQSIGTTPFTKSGVSYGKHRLVLRKDGYKDLSTSFTTGQPETTLAPYTLESLTPEPAPVPEPVAPDPVVPDPVVPTPAPEPIAPDPAPVVSDSPPRTVFFGHDVVGWSVTVEGKTAETPATFTLKPGTYTISSGAEGTRCTITVPESDPAVPKPHVVKLHEVCN